MLPPFSEKVFLLYFDCWIKIYALNFLVKYFVFNGYLEIMEKRSETILENFIYKNPTKLIFGKDQLQALKNEIPVGKKVLLVYGGGSIKKSGLYDRVLSELAQI